VLALALVLAALVLAASWSGPRTAPPAPQPPEQVEPRLRQQALRELQGLADAGETVVLIDRTGREKWARWVTPRDRPPLEPPNTPYRFLRAFEDPGLLELFPDPRSEGFLLSAEVQLARADPRAQAGLLLLADWKETRDGYDHRFVSFDLTVKPDGGGRVVLALHRLTEPTGPDRPSAYVPLRFKELTPAELKEWHRLSVRVSPEELVAELDGVPVGTVRRTFLARSLHGLKPRVGADPGPPPAPLPIRGPVGLHLQAAQARFRNVVLTPVPKP
jgi:hypothetical protein